MTSFDDYIYINFVNYDKKKTMLSQEIFDKYIGTNFIILDKISSINVNLENFLSYTTKNIIRIIPLNYFEYIFDMKKSYKAKKDILDQLSKDINRVQLYVNGNLVKSIYKIYNYLESKFSSKMVYEILMICNQSIMAIPCRIIQKSVKHYKNYYISETSILDNCDKNLKINIDITDDDIVVTGYKNLRIAEVIDSGDIKTVYILKIMIEVEFNNEIVFIKMHGNKINNNK